MQPVACEQNSTARTNSWNVIRERPPRSFSKWQPTSVLLFRSICYSSHITWTQTRRVAYISVREQNCTRIESLRTRGLNGSSSSRKHYVCQITLCAMVCRSFLVFVCSLFRALYTTTERQPTAVSTRHTHLEQEPEPRRPTANERKRSRCHRHLWCLCVTRLGTGLSDILFQSSPSIYASYHVFSAVAVYIIPVTTIMDGSFFKVHSLC